MSTRPALATPRLDAVLRRLDGSLRRSIWLYGLGSAVAGAALWLLFMYGADRLLQLPAPIRLIHLALLAAGTAWLLARTLLRHRRAVPDRAGLALLAQRALPANEAVDDRFINALATQLPDYRWHHLPRYGYPLPRSSSSIHRP